MHSVFISYRRADAAGYAGRLYDRLVEALGRDHVFMDIDSISYGEDFVEAISRTLAECDIVLVLIGPNWLNISDPNGARRLDSPVDTVRLEVATALELKRRVIPVLVGGAVMPDAQLLPAPLTALSRRNAIDISDRRFNKDAQELVDTLKGLRLHAVKIDPSSTAPKVTNAQTSTNTSQFARQGVPLRPTADGRLPPITGPRSFRVKLIALMAVLLLLLSITWIATSSKKSVVHDPSGESKSAFAPATLANERPSQVPPPSISASSSVDAAPPLPAQKAPLATAPASAPIQPKEALASQNKQPASTIEKATLDSKMPLAAASWLTSSLYGSDNNGAALKKVTIRNTGNSYKINILNQFNFECDLTFDNKGNLSSLLNCISKDEPRPICNPDMPNSLCATSSGCFRTKDEKNPACYESWVVEDSKIKLTCKTLKSEQVCRGGYTLATTKGFTNQAEFTIARKLH